MYATISGSIPYFWSPISASPLSFSMMRLKRGETASGPKLEPRKPSNHDVLTHLGNSILHQVFDRRRAVLDEGLLHQDLFLWNVRRQILLVAHKPRIGGGHLHRYIVRQPLEIVGARHKVGLTVHLDHGPDPSASVNVCLYQALARDSRTLLGSLGKTLLLQDCRGLYEIAAGLIQGSFAIHNPSPGLLPELFYLACSTLGQLYPSRTTNRYLKGHPTPCYLSFFSSAAGLSLSSLG